MDRICSFFGHKDVELTDKLWEDIPSAIKSLIEDCGVNTFYFDRFGDFDEYCHRAVSVMKAEYPNIERVFCLSDERHLNPRKRPSYLLKTDYEEFIYLPLDFDYWYSRLYYRNCEMINKSDFVVFYIRNAENSGAYKCFEYVSRGRVK